MCQAWDQFAPILILRLPHVPFGSSLHCAFWTMSPSMSPATVVLTQAPVDARCRMLLYTHSLQPALSITVDGIETFFKSNFNEFHVLLGGRQIPEEVGISPFFSLTSILRDMVIFSVVTHYTLVNLVSFKLHPAACSLQPKYCVTTTVPPSTIAQVSPRVRHRHIYKGESVELARPRKPPGHSVSLSSSFLWT